ncbi:MAG: DUF697 domain-containing protein [Sedimentisphaerales bacterium]|nr:DUF697 domain-containing protein [Sedimentisphaerales bacterium]
MLARWFRIIRMVIIIIGAVLSFFAVIEVLRAYQTLYNLHPWVGYVFLLVVIAVCVYLFFHFALSIATRPAVLIPPHVPDPKNASTRKLRRYIKYLQSYLSRLRTNLALESQDRDLARQGLENLAIVLETAKDKDALVTAILDNEDTVIRPLLVKIDEQAARHVRDCMRDVMIAVAVSPYKALDLFIVIYRNMAMVNRIVLTYNARPRLREQLQIGWDILAVVATVNYINMGKNLIEGIGSRVPGIGRFVDDIAQGMGAGFMTTIVGHAAMDRCRAFRGWDAETAKATIRSRIHAFYSDVRDIFKKDVLPSLLRRIGDTSRETVDKVATALDETGKAVTGFVKVPIHAATTAGNSVLTMPGRVTRYSAGRWQRLRNWFSHQPKTENSNPPEK